MIHASYSTMLYPDKKLTNPPFPFSLFPSTFSYQYRPLQRISFLQQIRNSKLLSEYKIRWLGQNGWQFVKKLLMSKNQKRCEMSSTNKGLNIPLDQGQNHLEDSDNICLKQFFNHQEFFSIDLFYKTSKSSVKQFSLGYTSKNIFTYSVEVFFISLNNSTHESLTQEHLGLGQW